MMKFLFLFFFGLQALAQEYETTVRESGFKSTDRIIIDEQTIKKSKATDVTTLLQSQANVAVSTAGFQQNSLFIRGGDSSHVLILIDGVPVYDPSTAQRTMNLNQLNIKSIRRIEVLRGAQTVLYGGQALAGVIKIETFGQDLKNAKSAQIEGGSFGYGQVNGLAQKPLDDNQAVQVSGNWFSRANPSPILDSTSTYPQKNLNTDVAYAYRGAQDITVRGFYIDDNSEIPSLSGPYKTVDSEDLFQKIHFTGLTTFWRNKTGLLKPEITANLAHTNRKFEQDSSSTEQIYASELQNFRGQVQLFENEKFLVVAGASYFKEKFVYRNLGLEQANSFGEQRGFFSKIDYTHDENWQFEAGGRVESTTSYNSEFSSQLGLTVYKRTRLEYATAFRTPSQFQYYGDYGNADLEPERAISQSIVHSVPIDEKQNVSIGAFEIQFSKMLATKTVGFLPKYFNVNRARVRGAEFLYAFQFLPSSQFSFRYTYQEPEDLNTGNWLIRRPLNIASANISHGMGPHTLGAEAIYNDERSAQTSSTKIRILEEFTLLNLVWSYQATEALTAYARVNNVTDHRYQESYDYYHEGRSGVLGLSWNW